MATLLCVGVVAAAGCGTDPDDERVRASGRDGGRPASETALVEVPDVTGQSAEAGGSALEAAGFAPVFVPSLDDPGLCTVADQDQSGEIEEGSEVVLTLECEVDVPDLSDEPADDAVTRLEGLGLRTRYEEEPREPSACTVEDQDVVGEAEPESEVVLSVLCKLPDLTGKVLETAVAGLERIGYRTDHRTVRDPSACTVTSHRSEAEPGATINLTVHCGSGNSSRPATPPGAFP